MVDLGKIPAGFSKKRLHLYAWVNKPETTGRSAFLKPLMVIPLVRLLPNVLDPCRGSLKSDSSLYVLPFWQAARV